MQYQESEIPQNDACENATELDLQSPSYLGNTIGALPEFEEPDVCSLNRLAGGDVWYKYTPTVNMNITVVTSAATFNHRIVVLTGESCSPSCVDSTYNYNAGATITFPAVQSMQYFIVIAGYSILSDTGTFTLTVTSDVEVPNTSPTSNVAPQTLNPTVKPSLRPVNAPTIVPIRTMSPIRSPPTNRPNLPTPETPNIPPVAMTLQPVNRIPTQNPRLPTTEGPTLLPVELPTKSPVELTSSPTKSPVVPPRKVPTNAPETDLPSAVPIVNIAASCPDGSPGPFFPDECDVDCPLSGPSVPGCVKFCDVRPIFGCAPVCSGTVMAILPGGCRERCCRDNNITPTDPPTSSPAVNIIETPNVPWPIPFRPVTSSDDDYGTGKGQNSYSDDNYSHKGKGRMHHYYSGGKSDNGIMSRYYNGWDLSGWNERRRSHPESRGGKA